MQKAYSRIKWENSPSVQTPVNEHNLNRMDAAVNEIDDRVIAVDTTKLDKTTASSMVKDVTFDEATGIFTVTYLNGATYNLDTKLEKLAMNWTYDKDAQQLVIALEDGTQQNVDLSTLITQYEFVETDTIAVSLGVDGKVSASVKDASITEDKLEPNYLADIKVESAKAESSAQNAATSEANASASEMNAKASETAAAQSENKAKDYASTAAQNAFSASTSFRYADEYAASAKTSAENASSSATEASEYAQQASISATAAGENRESSEARAEEAEGYARASQSYAVGGSGTRVGEDADNAKYYYEQARGISEGLNGTLMPMGTVLFANLESQTKQSGYMYNVSDAFVTTSTFKEGAGYSYPAGTNVYWTADGHWDCLAGTMVASVNGMKGDVTINAEIVGLGNVPNVTTNNQTPTYTDRSTLATLSSGEKLSVAFQKIKLAITTLINHLAASNPHGVTALQIGALAPSDVVDNLTSTDSEVPLSANQGKILNNIIGTQGAKLEGIEDGANKYVHPSTAGNKHIPAGGSAGQILKWSSAGTAVWGSDNDTVYDFEVISAEVEVSTQIGSYALYYGAIPLNSFNGYDSAAISIIPCYAICKTDNRIAGPISYDTSNNVGVNSVHPGTYIVYLMQVSNS